MYINLWTTGKPFEDDLLYQHILHRSKQYIHSELVLDGLTLSHPIALRVEYLRGPIDFRIAQHVWDDQIHLQNTH